MPILTITIPMKNLPTRASARAAFPRNSATHVLSLSNCGMGGAVVAFLVLWHMVTADVLMFVCLALAAMTGLAASYLTSSAWFHRWTTETDAPT